MILLLAGASFSLFQVSVKSPVNYTFSKTICFSGKNAVPNVLISALLETGVWVAAEQKT